MQTRRDQFQAYKYLVRRVLVSMIGNDPEAPEQPMRRVGGATAIGLLLGGLACGGVAVYGWLVGSIGEAWKEKNNVVIQEKASGAQFVYTKTSKGDEKALHPIPNFTTAQLITGSAKPEVKKLTTKSMNTVQKGAGMGIPDAPALLPSVKNLDPMPWTVCSRPQRESDRNQQAEYQTDVIIGDGDIGATPAKDRPIVVHPEGEEQELYVLYSGKRLEATSDALNALEFRDQSIAVSPTLLNAIPAGDPLQGPQLPRAGEQGAVLAGEQTTIGEVFLAEEQMRDDSPDAYWIMTAEGLRPLQPIQAELLLAPDGGAVRDGVAQTSPTPLPADELQAASQGQVMNLGDLPEVFPLRTPELSSDADPDSATVCAWYDDGGEPTFSLNGTVRGASTAAANAAATARDGTGSEAMVADHTIVETGKGAVVGVRPQGGGDPSVYYVVTDAGKRYQIPGDTLGTLGYSGKNLDEGEKFDPPTLPARLLKLVPEGPVLSPEQAKQPWP